MRARASYSGYNSLAAAAARVKRISCEHKASDERVPPNSLEINGIAGFGGKTLRRCAEFFSNYCYDVSLPFMEQCQRDACFIILMRFVEIRFYLSYSFLFILFSS